MTDGPNRRRLGAGLVVFGVGLLVAVVVSLVVFGQHIPGLALGLGALGYGIYLLYRERSG